MGFQNSINSALGSVGAAAALGRHMKNQQEALVNQEKELEVKKVEAEQEQYNAEQALKQNTNDITHKMTLEGRADELLPKKGENISPAQAEARGVQNYLEDQSEIAEDKYQEILAKAKNPTKNNKRLEMARVAADEKQAEIDARENLKFNLDIATKKLNALKGVK